MKQPELGKKVLELRQKSGLTQAELAEKCNLSLRTIQRIEALEVTPRNYTVKVIFSCLGYDLADMPDETSEESAATDSRPNRIERSIKYVRELFNLKTNTMKKLSVLSLFAVVLFAGIFLANTTLSAQGRQMKAAAESLEGIWQQVILDPETGEIDTYTPYLKILNTDGTYIHMSRFGDSRAFLNARGTWKVTAPDTFFEYIELTHKQEIWKQSFRLGKSAYGIILHSKCIMSDSDMDEIDETWVKCSYLQSEPVIQKF